jgi:hypothetical protein
MKLFLLASIAVLAAPAAAVDVYPDLVSGTYTFHGQPGGSEPAVDPEVTPTKSIGALRIDGAPLDAGVLDCQVVDPADYFAVLTFTVELTDMTQNAEVRIVAYPKEDCTGLGSPSSDRAARMFLVPPSAPILSE